MSTVHLATMCLDAGLDQVTAGITLNRWKSLFTCVERLIGYFEFKMFLAKQLEN
jgi:hypothetical protein